MAQKNAIYIGIGGTVLAVDRATGEELWRAPLKGDFVNVAVLDGSLLAAAKGELYCLDPATGNVLWKNSLKGLGRGLMSIAVPGGQQTVLAQEKKRRDDEAASAAVIAAS